MKRFISVMAGAALALSGSLVLAATPLPPELGGGGYVPPDATANKVEQGVAKNLTKLAAAVTKCHQKGVGNQFKAKPSGVAACTSAAVGKYNAGTAKLGGVPCIDGPTQVSTGTTVAGLVPAFDPTLWCDGSVALDGEMGGGFVPTDSTVNKTEQSVSKILIKHVGAVSKCALKAVGNLFKGKPDGYTACEAAARTKADASVAKIQAAINALNPGDCLKGANAPSAPGPNNDLLDVVTGLTLSFNGTIFCASPSGAFLN
jgi:hypothetical protein